MLSIVLYSELIAKQDCCRSTTSYTHYKSKRNRSFYQLLRIYLLVQDTYIDQPFRTSILGTIAHYITVVPHLPNLFVKFLNTISVDD